MQNTLIWFLVSVRAALQRLLGVDTPPNKVYEVKGDALEHLQIIHRDDGMMMYAPAPESRDKKAVWEIVIHRPYSDGPQASYR